jgi:biopolymer transport protein ExbD
MALKKRLSEQFDDINIMPLMNIIMLLIPFLIMSAEFITIGIIEVTAPRLNTGETTQSEPDKEKEKPLNLTISVTGRGYTLITRGDQISQGCDISPEAMNAPEKKLPTVPKIDDKYDNLKLRECLAKIKKVFPDEKRVIIMAEPKIQYQVIIEIMDHSRELSIGKDDLFPQVVLSAGVI